MKKFILGACCGFAGALMLFPAAQAQVAATCGALEPLRYVLTLVHANYVRDVSDADLVQGAIGGVMTSLDAHSKFTSPKEYAVLQAGSQAGARGSNGAGIGLVMQNEFEFIKILNPVQGGPAEAAGIKSGDFLLSIDGQSMKGVSTTEATEKLLGPQNSPVAITIHRPNQEQPLSFVISRKFVSIKNPIYERRGNVGYIQQINFDSGAEVKLRAAIADLKKQIGPGLQGYILDLRNNPGGLLDSAIQLSDIFLDGGLIVSTRGRNAQDNQRYDARPGDDTGGKPVIVLINEGTAAGAEIFAGALQDHHRATIIGVKSFGAGTLQTILPLGEAGGALRLTTGKFYLPSGLEVDGNGITPDIKVEAASGADAPLSAALARLDGR